MRRVMCRVMERRAERLAARLQPFMPAAGPLLDVGCGTGHTAQALERQGWQVIGADVVGLAVVGAPPVLFDGRHLPFADASFTGAMLLFVLSYAADPAGLLREARRVSDGSVLVMQSTYAGPLGWAALCANELAWGPVAFLAARAARLVGAVPFSLGARRFYTRPALQALFGRSGVAACLAETRPWRGMPVHSDLYVLD